MLLSYICVFHTMYREAVVEIKRNILLMLFFFSWASSDREVTLFIFFLPFLQLTNNYCVGYMNKILHKWAVLCSVIKYILSLTSLAKLLNLNFKYTASIYPTMVQFDLRLNASFYWLEKNWILVHIIYIFFFKCFLAWFQSFFKQIAFF